MREEYGKLRAYLSHNHIKASTFVRQTVFGQEGGTSYKAMHFVKTYDFNGEKVNLYLRTNPNRPCLVIQASSEEQYHLSPAQSHVVFMPQ